ncbi:dipeptide/oligopeptide/nickel ABC transporter permease/ATP-binding protein [Streptomyces sp. NPDC015661]|uniref:dipeptide/oligopeptide/nickel ABC transporter permease/ATP-binding protein n=1 Tax=Streptomyces sp. NPDC015661 TaxID=3364961 RepID=UPI0036FDC494
MKRWNTSLRIGVGGMAAIALLAAVAPLVWDGEAEELGAGPSRAAMSSAHWLGTDALGRDLFARTMVATRLTLEMSLAAAALASLLGVLLGSAVWVSGPGLRRAGLRVIDVAVSYPALILALVVAAVADAGPVGAVCAIGIGGSPSFARLTANLAASVAGRDYVATARLLGVPPWRVLTRHLLPNISGPLLVLLSVAFAQSLTALSALSFLGLGVQPPDYDWGALLGTGLKSVYTNPVEALGPAAAITLTGVLAGLVGDGLAALVDPHSSAGSRSRKARSKRPHPVATPADGHAHTVASRELSRTEATAAPDADDAVLHVDGLTVQSEDGTMLVDGVSFTIGRGERLGLVGESGSGKSLTAMAVARLLPTTLHAEASRLDLSPESGGPAVDLIGADVPATLLATGIGVVFQDTSSSFNPALRMGGQLTETIRVHGKVPATAARSRAVAALERVHIRAPETVVRQYPHQLSGGMRQRAMIAAALLTEPHLLIADEPTTALDVTVQAEVVSLLNEVTIERGLATLFISHDIGVVGALCTRVLVMYSGRVVEELSAAALTAGRARHPYSRALLAATPKPMGADGSGPLATIPGRPPVPHARPAGCSFAPRCAEALDICHTDRPRLLDGVACHAVVRKDAS